MDENTIGWTVKPNKSIQSPCFEINEWCEVDVASAVKTCSVLFSPHKHFIPAGHSYKYGAPFKSGILLWEPSALAQQHFILKSNRVLKAKQALVQHVMQPVRPQTSVEMKEMKDKSDGQGLEVSAASVSEAVHINLTVWWQQRHRLNRKTNRTGSLKRRGDWVM